MTIDPTSKGLVHHFEGTASIAVEPHAYSTAQGPLPFDLYRPTAALGPRPAVVFVTGFRDPGTRAYFGKPMKDWAMFTDWARLVAASGLVAVTYENREPEDGGALVRHLETSGPALGIDGQRIGFWSCSGHVPNALALIARERPACAALLYGYTLDLDGSTLVKEALAPFLVAPPALTVAELPRATQLLMVRAGKDRSPGMEENLQRFLVAARAQQLSLTLLDHVEAPHAFDLDDPSPRSREVIEEVIAFLRRSLGEHR